MLPPQTVERIALIVRLMGHAVVGTWREEGVNGLVLSIAFEVPAGEGCGVVEELTECAAVRCSNARVHIHGFTPR